MHLSTQFYNEHTTHIMKIVLNIFLPAISFVMTTAGLEVNWLHIVLAAGSSVAGSLLLGYFRPEKTLGSQLNKMAMATIGGLIVGSAIVQYKDLTNNAYISLAYFTASIVVLIFVRTFVGLFEANAGSLTTTLIQRVFNVKLDKGRDENGNEIHRTKGGTRRRTVHKDGDIHISQQANCPPTVEIGPGAKPDEIKVIEQTVVENKKEGN